MNIDILEFANGYCQEFEKHALQTPNPAAALGGGLKAPATPAQTLAKGTPYRQGEFATEPGIWDTLHNAFNPQPEINRQAMLAGNIGGNQVSKVDAHGNLVADKKGLTNAAVDMAPGVAKGMFGKATDWMKEHPLMTGGIGAGLLSMLALPMLMGGNRDEGDRRQIVINNNMASTAPGRPIGPAFLNT